MFCSMLKIYARNLPVRSLKGSNRIIQHCCFLLKNTYPINFLRVHHYFLQSAQRGNSTFDPLMSKRKLHSLVTNGSLVDTTPIAASSPNDEPASKRRTSQRKVARKRSDATSTNPDKNAYILDAAEALRASPDAGELEEHMDVARVGIDLKGQTKDQGIKIPVVDSEDSSSTLSDIADLDSPIERDEDKCTPKASKVVKNTKPAPSIQAAKAKKVSEQPQFLDPEAEGIEEAGEEEVQAALSRPPPVNSDYIPLPWKGRLGYACLCTYLRFSNPPIFSSRTCRIASILENRHPLKNPNEPPHPTKNRPDKDQPASIERGQAFVESLGLANARDIVKMLRWNDRYGIKFFRLSSEMFPFASHEEYGYRLAPFAAEALAEAGRVAAELGHRLTTHPGQFTQLGSPRKQVITSSIRDLEFHAELLSLLKLPPQQDRDAVMILHLGGVFGDKAATLDRFRENYKGLSQGIKDRLVLENDDVSWSVYDLLPLCEELNIPMVLDFHHHNIIFDADQIREGTKDIMDLFPRIIATWQRKNITPKMHYSEPQPSAITASQRRKHSPRVATLPPCPPTMDLMIEAKDKEQAVFELMRNFKLPGYGTINDMIPHVRNDENKASKAPKKNSQKKAKNEKAEDEDAIDGLDEEPNPALIAASEVGMGGPQGRVYWPPGMEHWLRPVKKTMKPRAAQGAAQKQDEEHETRTPAGTPAKKMGRRAANSQTDKKSAPGADDELIQGGTTTNSARENGIKGVNEAEGATPTIKRARSVKKTPKAEPPAPSVPTPKIEAEVQVAAATQGDTTRDRTTSAIRKSKRATAKKII